MTVLVVGTWSAAQASADALRCAGARVVHEPRPGRAAARLAAAPEHFVLVLAESMGAGCMDTEFLEGIAETGTRAPVLFFAPATGHGGRDAVSSACGLEATAGGRRVLRCALAEALVRPGIEAVPGRVPATRPHVFVYSGPARNDD